MYFTQLEGSARLMMEALQKEIRLADWKVQGGDAELFSENKLDKMKMYPYRHSLYKKTH